jgi:acetyl esterase
MNPIKRIVAKILSVDIDLKRHYKLYRKVLGILRPVKKWTLFYDRKVYDGTREIPVRIFAPEPKAAWRPGKVLVFFHGGGWVTGNIDTYTETCARLSDATGCVVISVDYRLAPEHPFPAGLEDCYAVASAVANHPKQYFSDGELILIGDSAGGNLAAVVSLMAAERKEFRVSRQALFYPAVNNDYSENSPFDSVRENGEDYILTRGKIVAYMGLYLNGKEEKDNPYVAPILASDLTNQPETLIVTAELDPLRDEGEAYGRRLREAGNTVSIQRINGALHGFLSMPKSFSVDHVEEILNGFLDGTLKGTDGIHDEKEN